MNHAPKRMLTVSETADLLQVSDRTVRRLLADGALPSHQLGRCRRISRDDLDAFLSRNRKASFSVL